jgi:hypothetical protein
MPTNTQNDTPAGQSPVLALAHGSAPCLKRYQWDDRNRTLGFATWADEIAHVEAQGYILVPPDYHIPHWSQADKAPKLYANGREGVLEVRVAFNRPASDLGYPLFFLPNVMMSQPPAGSIRRNG